MFKNYLKIAWRNLIKNKGYSAINIGGLAIGMGVAMLIGIWVWDEISFDDYHKNKSEIGQAWQFVTFDAEKSSYNSLPIPLAAELRNNYPDFQSVSLATYNRDLLLANGNTQISKTGMFVEHGFPEMMSAQILQGTSDGLDGVQSIMLSKSLAKILFPSENPINHTVKLNNELDAMIIGIYADFPANSSFHDVLFLAPWDLFVLMDQGAKDSLQEWDNNSYQIFVQLRPGVDFVSASSKIKGIRMRRDNPPGYKPEFFIHPMKKWHLYGEFKNGANEGGLAKMVWLFGIIGIFVLLLACINFMNLSTARSEKRAKEVGIRKTIGSNRGQLIYQFLSESVLVSFIALIMCLILVRVALPFFNEVAEKEIGMPWQNPIFWMVVFGFSLITGIISGSYPAFYLSAFRPVKILKGSFRVGKGASLPRKTLVVFQFMVSITLIIGTIIIFRQINFAQERPMGYDYNGLIEVTMRGAPEISDHFEALRDELLKTGVVSGVSQSLGSVTDDFGGTTAISWPGKSPEKQPLIMKNAITHDYGKTIGWKILEGRDFSRDFSIDTSAVIINRAAAKLMGFQNPLESHISFVGKDYDIIGVVDNVIKDSPFSSVKPSIFTLDYENVNVLNIKLSQESKTQDAILEIGQVLKAYSPLTPFDYKFVDEKYRSKFANERRIGELAGFFAFLAIFISCLGLFGLASFIAEQRTKELGVRKVLGASVYSLWQMLSREFVFLVLISCAIAIPVASYFMERWLQNYEYRTEISWWIFGIAVMGALLITIFTVSFHAIKAAYANPVKSLRTE